jgi:hypothetical protein
MRVVLDSFGAAGPPSVRGGSAGGIGDGDGDGDGCRRGGRAGFSAGEYVYGGGGARLGEGVRGGRGGFEFDPGVRVACACTCDLPFPFELPNAFLIIPSMSPTVLALTLTASPLTEWTAASPLRVRADDKKATALGGRGGGAEEPVDDIELDEATR